MENVVLTVHLILALFLIGAVLLQRSEGGAIFGSSGGFVTSRGATTALAKVTWGLAVAFIATSLVLTALAANRAAENSVIDRITGTPAATAPLPPPSETAPALPPALPPAATAPAPLPPATDSVPAPLPPAAAPAPAAETPPPLPGADPTTGPAAPVPPPSE